MLKSNFVFHHFLNLGGSTCRYLCNVFGDDGKLRRSTALKSSVDILGNRSVIDAVGDLLLPNLFRSNVVNKNVLALVDQEQAGLWLSFPMD
jgi:hypothetical protein